MHPEGNAVKCQIKQNKENTARNVALCTYNSIICADHSKFVCFQNLKTCTYFLLFGETTFTHRNTTFKLRV